MYFLYSEFRVGGHFLVLYNEFPQLQQHETSMFMGSWFPQVNSSYAECLGSLLRVSQDQNWGIGSFRTNLGSRVHQGCCSATGSSRSPGSLANLPGYSITQVSDLTRLCKLQKKQQKISFIWDCSQYEALVACLSQIQGTDIKGSQQEVEPSRSFLKTIVPCKKKKKTS